MEQIIYIPILIYQRAWMERISVKIREALQSLEVDGVAIVDVQNYRDEFVEYFMQLLEHRNRKEGQHDNHESCVLIEVTIETTGNLIYQNLPWLEECIKGVIKNMEYGSGVYFWYLIENGKRFKSLNCLKVYKQDGIHYKEDINEDDMSPLFDHVDFFDRAFYDDDFTLDDYPALAAKILLCRTPYETPVSNLQNELTGL